MSDNELWVQSSAPWKPHAYQKKAMKFLVERPHGALFLDPGLGKTSISLGVLKALLQRKLTKGALIVAPLRVCHSVWPKEVKKWTDFKHLSVQILHGAHKEQALKTKADVYVINPEGLEWLVKAGRIQWLLSHGVDTLIVDELSKFKHAKTARFKLLKPWLKKFKRRYGLTGSPASNGLLDLFGQCLLLDLGATLGQYITHFKMQYFYPSGYNGYTWLPRMGAEDEIYQKIAPLALRMAADDYLELPELVNNVIKVDLPAAARKVYRQMEQEAFTILDDDKLATAANAAAVTSKCRQIANGGVYTDQHMGEVKLSGKREWKEIHNAKIEALSDLVEELQGTPLLVAYEFQHDLERILKALGPVPYIGGGVSPKKAAEYERQWNAGELPVLLGHPQSIGHGLNLQGKNAHNVCWFGLIYDLELYEQFIQRVRRQGNTAGRVMVHHIMANQTVDQAIFAALKKKGKAQSRFLEALAEYRLAM